MHELPADFFDVTVPVPASRLQEGARYVQLSSAYEAAAAEARSRGWLVVGGPHRAHLDVATEPGRVAALLG